MATNAPALEIKPSITTGIRLRALSRTMPQIAPISRPPTAASVSSGPFIRCLLMRIPFSITSILFSSALSSIPVPLPVTSSTSILSKTANKADDGVVLPIPISPLPRISAPSSIACRAVSIPTAIEARACSDPIAGPWVKLAVPFMTLAEIKPSAITSAATPTSTTRTSAPTCRASTLTPAPPLRKLYTICWVTSWGTLLTPSLTTP